MKKNTILMKKALKNSLVIILISIAQSIHAQLQYESFKNVLPRIEQRLINNDLLSTTLEIDSLHSCKLKITNVSIDTIQIVSRFKLEGVSKMNFILFCYADTCVRNNNSVFNFHDEFRYKYTHTYYDYYNPDTDELHCFYYSFFTEPMIPVPPMESVYLNFGTFDLKKKFLFIKIQFMYFIGYTCYLYQQDTNSVYLP